MIRKGKTKTALAGLLAVILVSPVAIQAARYDAGDKPGKPDKKEKREKHRGGDRDDRHDRYDRYEDRDDDGRRGYHDRVEGVPPGHLPPPGECRVWYDDEPPGQQPPPTDCATARREAARTGGRVVYGGDGGRDDRYDEGWDYGEWGDCRTRDGRRVDCDWEEERCVDRDGDGWCDARWDDARYPASLPEMVWGQGFGRGERPPGLRPWLPHADATVRLRDLNGDGRPEDVVWLDPLGVVLQRWVDVDRDGRADRVALYRGGRVWRVIRP